MTNESRDWVRCWLCLWLTVLATVAAAGAHLFDWCTWQLLGADGWHFSLGVLVALPVGHYAVIPVLRVFRKKPSASEARRRAKWMGCTERTFFALVVAASLPWSIAGAVLWASAKMAANWGPRVKAAAEEEQGEKGDSVDDVDEDEDDEDAKAVRIKAMSALASTLTGLTFAVAGGLIIQASLP